jgi:ligand-binding sensor domain-containing protein
MLSKIGIGYSLFAALLVVVVCIGCSRNIAGGGTEDVNTKIVAGIIVDSQGKAVAGADLMLLRPDYNPAVDGIIPDAYKTISNASGAYRFVIQDSGYFNIYCTAPAQTSFLRQGVHIVKETVCLNDTVKNAGAVRVALPDTVDSLHGYVYIPGSPLISDLSKEMLFVANGKRSMIFDFLPACRITVIKYGIHTVPTVSTILKINVIVTENDTVGDIIKELWTSFTTTNSPLPENNIACAAMDGSGQLWIGTGHGGIAVLNGTAWKSHTIANSPLPSDSVLALGAENNNMWIGTPKGISFVQNGSWTIYNKDNSMLPENVITGIAFTSDGLRWFSCLRGYLMYNNQNQKWSQTVMVGSIALNGTLAVTVDRTGKILWACEFGYIRSEPKDSNRKWIPIFDDNSSFTEIRDIAVDRNNSYWLASPKGIIVHTGSSWQVFSAQSNGLPSNNISCIAVDQNNVVWAGCKGTNSIIRITNGAIKIYTPDDVIVLKNVVSINKIFVDKKNNIFFATEKGGLVKLEMITVESVR